jgi:hypothetical protein
MGKIRFHPLIVLLATTAVSAAWSQDENTELADGVSTSDDGATITYDASSVAVAVAGRSAVSVPAVTRC